MTGIYKYTNLLNGKIYIGQAENIEKRQISHLYDSKNLEFRKGTGVDYAIAKYGIENFSFEIIEECPVEQLDSREAYWIKYYNSYLEGYNRTEGGKALRGEQHPRAILTEVDVWDIREEYAKKILRRYEVFEKYLDLGITERGLKKIWDGETWENIHMDVYTQENREWHRKNDAKPHTSQIGLSSEDRRIKKEEVELWKKEREQGLSINQIAKKYHRDNGIVLKYLNDPSQLNQKIKYRGRQLKNLETEKVFTSISAAARWAGCGATTLTRHLASDKIAGKVPETQQPATWIELS